MLEKAVTGVRFVLISTIEFCCAPLGDSAATEIKNLVFALKIFVLE